MRIIVFLLIFKFIIPFCYGALSENLDNVIVYPNPFRQSKGHTRITFDNLTLRVKLKIIKITGELVYENLIDTNNGKFIWDVLNNDKQKIASGLYLYILTDENGNKIKGKIIIIK